MIIKMLTKLQRRMDKPSENFNKEIKNIRKHQREVTELKNVRGMKNTLEGINSRLENKELISDLIDRVVAITQTEDHRKKKRF